MESDQVDRYLARIDAERPVRTDVTELARLQRAHLRTVPFENLSIHLGEPIVLNPSALYDKIVVRRRGGFCYELNGLFAMLLRALGFPVDLLQARVHGPTGFGPPFDHMALRVLLDEPWLVDVGFGRFAIGPLRLDEVGDQADPEGVFRIEPDGADLVVLMNGERQYRLDQRNCDLADFVPTCWWQSTSPDSHFTQSLTCSAPTEHGRVTLSGDRLIVTDEDGRTERTLDDGTAILDAYRWFFGMDLDRVPKVAS